MAVSVTVAVLWFLGVTAFGGGLAMMLGYTPPAAWLDGIPVVTNWVVPGLVLGLGFGLGSLVTGFGVLRRPHVAWLGFAERLTGHHWSWSATILIGLGHIAWIALELVYLPELSVLQAVYGPIGVALAGLPLLPSVRGYLRAPR